MDARNNAMSDKTSDEHVVGSGNRSSDSFFFFLTRTWHDICTDGIIFTLPQDKMRMIPFAMNFLISLRYSIHGEIENLTVFFLVKIIPNLSESYLVSTFNPHIASPFSEIFYTYALAYHHDIRR